MAGRSAGFACFRPNGQLYHSVDTPWSSGRALRVLDQQGYLSPEEMDGARAVLHAAALTYVAAAISSLLQLVRLLIIARNRRD